MRDKSSSGQEAACGTNNNRRGPRATLGFLEAFKSAFEGRHPGSSPGIRASWPGAAWAAGAACLLPASPARPAKPRPGVLTFPPAAAHAATARLGAVPARPSGAQRGRLDLRR